MTNVCEENGCRASCCHGTVFNFSPEQYKLWISLGNVVTVDEVSGENFPTIAGLTNRRSGTNIIFHATVDSDNGVRDLVKIDGKCPLLQDDFTCLAWGTFVACNNLTIGSNSCSKFRKRDGLLPVSTI